MSGELIDMLSIFDKYKQGVLTFPVNIQGKDDMMYLVRELMHNDGGDSVDVDALIRRMNKLPAVLTFFGTMQWQAQREVEDAKQEFDAWYASEAETANTEMIKAIQGMEVAAGLKKAPTLDQIKGRVMMNNKPLWEEKKAPLRKAEERQAVLDRLMSGLQAAIKLAQSEGSLIATLINRGIEVPGVKAPDSPNARRFTPKPQDEHF